MQQEHPFAEYIRILGKGKKGSRGLTREEAHKAMSMIMNDEVLPIQLGAFLMLMRVKEESPEEVAGAVEAIKESLKVPKGVKVDLDWSSYAGKKRQLPWYILSTLLLAQNGMRVFMHGASGHTAGRLYTKDVLAALGLPVAHSLKEATKLLDKHNFAYIDLEHMSTRLYHIIELRPYLGLRSPVHTIARMLNPFDADYVMQGIFHPGYRPMHQEAGIMLDIPHMAVIKGEGGEIERNPDMPCLVQSVHNGEMSEQEWPAMFKLRHVRKDDLNVDDLVAIWRGEQSDEYGEAAVIGTVAITLQMMGRADSIEQAEQQAQAMWQARNKTKLGSAA